MPPRRAVAVDNTPSTTTTTTIIETTSGNSKKIYSNNNNNNNNNVLEIAPGTTLSLDGTDITTTNNASGRNDYYSSSDDNNNDDGTESLSRQQYQETEPLSSSNNNNTLNNPTVDRHIRRIRNWKESPFAVGLTEVTWVDERTRSIELPDDDSGCLWCSAYICPWFNAARVGNMIVLKSSYRTVDIVTDDIDSETGQPIIERIKQPSLDCIVGPYWPMLVFVTYPLILGVSGWTLVSIYNNGLPVLLILIWVLCTIGLIVALGFTACRDPGILHRVRDIPSPNHHHQQSTNNKYQQQQQYANWRWTEKADTYRPRSAWYDSDTAVVVEGFDHTCPWTGTAIGRKNMLAFQTFVCLIFICLLMDIFIITGTFSNNIRFG